MDDTELFAKLLEVAAPWRVTRVAVNVPAARIDVWVEETPGTKYPARPAAPRRRSTTTPRPRSGATWTPASARPRLRGRVGDVGNYGN